MSGGTIVVVHGAGSGPEIFDSWREDLAGAELVTPDLHEGLQVGRASMNDYAEVVATAVKSARPPVVLCGWSMGGLVAAMSAQIEEVSALVLLEASPPAEVQGGNDDVSVEPGTFDPEAAYGAFPPGVTPRPESSLARAERKKGISIPRLNAPALVVYGDEFADDRGRAVARFYGCEELHLEGLDHWGLVLDPRTRAAIVDFARRTCGFPPSSSGSL